MVVDPVRTGNFGVSGHLIMAGTFGIGEADYWYHTPFFWLVEESGEVIFRNGNGRHDIGQGDPTSALRMLPKPVFFADKLGFRLESQRRNCDDASAYRQARNRSAHSRLGCETYRDRNNDHRQ